MAAVASPPFRSPPSSLPAAAISSGPPNSSTPSKKVAAGRRRLEEFKQKKAAEKGKKNAGPAVSDDITHNVADALLGVSQQRSDSSSSSTNPGQSNGFIKEIVSDNLNVVSAEDSSPPEVAEVLLTGGKQASANHSNSEAQMSTLRPVETQRDVKPIPRNDVNKATEALSAGSVGVPIINSSGVSSSKEDNGLGLGSTPGLDTRSTKRSPLPTPPIIASRPAHVSASPVSLEMNGPLWSATEQRRVEPGKNPVGIRSPSPFNQISSASQGSQGILNPSNQKLNGADLLMLDNRLVLHQSSPQEVAPQPLQKPGSDIPSSANSQLAPTLVPSIEKTRTEKQSDRVNSTSSSMAISQNMKANSLSVTSETEMGSVHPAEKSSFAMFPSSGNKSSFTNSESPALSRFPLSEAIPSQLLPRPAPVFSSAISSLPLHLNNTANSGSVSSTMIAPGPSRFSTASNSQYPSSPSTSFQNDAFLPRPSAPFTFQFPAPVKGFASPHENGNAETIGGLSGPLSPNTDFLRLHKDLSHQSRPPSSGGDDFTMLEQHIEDLTQEKFSLQRGLDSARALLDTLAQENSALTEDYNNQGALVNELKAENERQQGEIRAQAVVVKKMKVERDKAVQDSNAAVERSQALAAEVISLEEKILRARSHELKLEKDMELLNSEIEVRKKQISSLDKDRTNLKTLVDALQEEKGLLQTQIRKAVAGKSVDLRQTPVQLSVPDKNDAATSTDDLEMGSHPMSINGIPSAVVSLEYQQALSFGPSSKPLLPLIHNTEESGSSSYPDEAGTVGQSAPSFVRSVSGRGLKLGPQSSVLPQEQAATISNINTLITELAEEKEALLKALRSESVGAAQLRALNSELSHKLEVQTQRLELAVAQNMQHNSNPTEGSNYAVSRIGTEYVDEGDEVVDRVLTWIMQLFPSGSSRRKRL